ncbi:SDR family NAD(P)-dependent oxidoreductase [Nesterenkonia sp. CF4.4]|uniref:SDR family NAD(P)-dependent oxidoreductase n=1 Tax=Nesterenkonia sp. CF4.4 TaxID=3373079 RepID=UPI003EE4554C
MKPLRHDRQTVLITGASSGIGAEFARRLAAAGSHLVLVARRLDRLDTLAAELRARHDVQVHTIAADLSEAAPGEALLTEVEARGIHVTSVINNAGFGIWATLDESDPAELRKMIAVNVSAVMDISRAFIAGLRQSGNGYLLNITSLAAYSSIPMQGAYSAAKAFVLSFTESLWAEVRGTGLRVLAYAPGITRTEFFDVSGGNDAGPSQSAEEVVEGALRVLGRRNPPPSWVSGHLNHVIAILPRYFTRRRAVLLTAATTMRDQPRV